MSFKCKKYSTISQTAQKQAQKQPSPKEFVKDHELNVRKNKDVVHKQSRSKMATGTLNYKQFIVVGKRCSRVEVGV